MSSPRIGIRINVQKMRKSDLGKGAFQRLFGTERLKPIELVGQRFLQAFQNHGVSASQIPRLLPQIRLDDLETPQKLIAALSPDILDQTAEFFGIRRQWLEGVDDQIYSYLACYKNPSKILKHVAELRNVDSAADAPFRILSTTKHLSNASGDQQLMAPVVLEVVAWLGDEPIYRDGFDWSHYPCRIELKALARIVFHRMRITAPIFVISEKEMREVLDGKLIPRYQLDGCLNTDPSLEDFALSRTESLVAKEIEELPAVLQCIEKNDLDIFMVGEGTADAESLNGPTTEAALNAPTEWKTIARAIADELDTKDAECGAYDSLRNMADRVAVAMRNRNVHGPRGPLSRGTVLRESLQGGRWKRKR